MSSSSSSLTASARRSRSRTTSCSAESRSSTRMRRLRECVGARSCAEVGMNAELVRLGLEYEVGNGGSRLSYSQRQPCHRPRPHQESEVLVPNGPPPVSIQRPNARATPCWNGQRGARSCGHWARRLARAFDAFHPRRRPSHRAGTFVSSSARTAPVAFARVTARMLLHRLARQGTRHSAMFRAPCALAAWGSPRAGGRYEARADYRETIKVLRPGDTLRLAQGSTRMACRCGAVRRARPRSSSPDRIEERQRLSLLAPG
jgi:hypothetical protein